MAEEPDRRVAHALFYYDDQDECFKLSEEATRMLEEIGNEPVAVAGIVGTYRKGKSTFMNLMVDGKSPTRFGTSAGAQSFTRGIMCWLADCPGFPDSKPEATPEAAWRGPSSCPKRPQHILYLDVEGADAPSGHSQRWKEYALNAAACLLSSVLFYWHWEGPITTNFGIVTSLLLFAERAKRSTTGEDGGGDFSMPALFWLFRDWDMTGMEFDPTVDYIKECVEQVDSTLAEQLLALPQFYAEKLVKPVAGAPKPDAFKDIVPEYTEIMEGIRSRAESHMTARWNGRGLLRVCNDLLSILNGDDFVPSAWTSACSNANLVMAEDCAKASVHHFADAMDELDLPLNSEPFEEATQEIVKREMDQLRQTLLGFLSDAVIDEHAEQAREAMEKKSDLYRTFNKTKCQLHCQTLKVECTHSYTQSMKGITLPTQTATVQSKHCEFSEAALSDYGQRCRGDGETVQTYRRQLEDELAIVFEETLKDNETRSEAHCAACVEPAYEMFDGELGSINIPSEPKALLSALKNAQEAGRSSFRGMCYETGETMRSLFEGQLETRMQERTEEVMEMNEEECRSQMEELLPRYVEKYRQSMGVDPGKGVIAADELRGTHARSKGTTLGGFKEGCIGPKEMISEYHARLEELIAKAYADISVSNAARAEQFCERTRETAFSIYTKNMRLLEHPLLFGDLESAHAENERLALQHFKEHAVGPEDVLLAKLKELKEFISYALQHARRENEVPETEAFVQKRSDFLHTWNPRRLSLQPKERLLQHFTEKGALKGDLYLDQVTEIERGCTPDIKLPPATSPVYPSSPDNVLQIHIKSKKDFTLYFQTSEDANKWHIWLSNCVSPPTAEGFFGHE